MSLVVLISTLLIKSKIKSLLDVLSCAYFDFID